MNERCQLGVDAGNISILDSAFILENGGVLTKNRFLRQIKVDPGTYEVSIRIPESDRGPVISGEIKTAYSRLTAVLQKFLDMEIS